MKDSRKKGNPQKIQAIQKSFGNTIKKSKQFYFTRFFQKNIKDLKNMWKGIKKIRSSNNSNHSFSTAITANNEAVINPFELANAFNNYFAKVAVDI